MFSELPRDELKKKARNFACGLAAADYEREHPGCTGEEARTYAARNWEPMLDQAIQFMAMCDVLDLLRDAARWN